MKLLKTLMLTLLVAPICANSEILYSDGFQPFRTSDVVYFYEKLDNDVFFVKANCNSKKYKFVKIQMSLDNTPQISESVIEKLNSSQELSDSKFKIEHACSIGGHSNKLWSI